MQPMQIAGNQFRSFAVIAACVVLTSGKSADAKDGAARADATVAAARVPVQRAVLTRPVDSPIAPSSRKPGDRSVPAALPRVANSDHSIRLAAHRYYAYRYHPYAYRYYVSPNYSRYAFYNTYRYPWIASSPYYTRYRYPYGLSYSYGVGYPYGLAYPYSLGYPYFAPRLVGNYNAAYYPYGLIGAGAAVPVYWDDAVVVPAANCATNFGGCYHW
jgi:hypothetical protein